MRKHNKKAQLLLTSVIVIALVLGSAFYFGFVSFDAKAFTQEDAQESIQKELSEQDKEDVVSNPDKEFDNDVGTGEQEATAQEINKEEIKKECTVSGGWKQLWVKGKTSQTGVDSGDNAQAIFEYTGTCTQDIYLEVGIIPQTKASLSAQPATLGFTSAKPSACDGNKNYYGALFKEVKKGEFLRVTFNPKEPTEEGSYKLIAGAYTGCLSDKTTQSAISATGKALVENTYSIKVSDKLYKSGIYETKEAKESWERKI